MSEDVFGGLGELPDFVSDSVTDEEEPKQEEVPAEVSTEEAPAPEAEAPVAVEEQPAQEEQPLTAEEIKLLAGKYKSVEDLEKGYNELRDLQRRTAERAKAADLQRQELEARSMQIQQALQQTIPVVQQALAARAAQQQQTDPYGLDTEQQQPGLDPRMVMPLVDMQVQQRMLEMQNATAVQQAAAMEYNSANDALQQFYSAHPEVEPQGEVDASVAQTIVALNQAWRPSGSTLDLTSPDVFEIAYEATKRPALRQVLEVNPAFIDTDAGMELARRQAALLEADITPSTTSAPGATRTTQKKPIVERASSGTPPATEGTQSDEFESAVLAFRKERESKGSIFF
jgi:hypothetical protein